MRLYLFEGSSNAVWTRRLEGDGLDAMAAEVIANVTVSIGLALQVGEVRDMEPIDPADLQARIEAWLSAPRDDASAAASASASTLAASGTVDPLGQSSILAGPSKDEAGASRSQTHMSKAASKLAEKT